MREIRSILMLHWIDTRYSYTIFWSILIGITLFTLVFVLALALTDGNINFGGSISIYIYLIIHSFINVRETFPYALGMGSTRTNYYVGTFLSFAILAAVTSIFQSTYHYLGEMVFNAFGIEGNIFINISLLTDHSFSPLTTLWLDFIIAFLLLCTTNLFSSILFRFGKLVMFIVLGLIVFTIITPGINEMWVNLIHYFKLSNWFELISLWGPMISVLAFVLSYSFMRRSSSRPMIS